ncbi:MAG: hypothetical protein Q9184_004842 [Pyrenodesmia sp. 2 TL-2023]
MALNSINQILDRFLERTALLTHLKRTLEELESQQAVNEKLLPNEGMAANQKQATNDHPAFLNPTTTTWDIQTLKDNDILFKYSIEVLEKINRVLKEQYQALYGTLNDDIKDIKNRLDAPRSFDVGGNSGYIIVFTSLLPTILTA